MKKQQVSPPFGFLTATQFASDCQTDGLPILIEHTLWLIEEKFIMPIAKIDGVNYFSEYQIYILDLIEDRRLQSLDYPKGPGVTRAGETLKSYYPETTWQEYVLLNKKSIITADKQWSPIAKLLLEIQPLNNNFLRKALANKEAFEKLGDGRKEPIGPALSAVIENDGPTEAHSILKKYPDLSEDILRLWKNKVLRSFVIKHNPAILLSPQRPDLLNIFLDDRTEPSSIFTRGNPIRLSNLYLRMISYLNFFVSCLNAGQEPEVKDIFISHYSEKICEICSVPFMPNRNRGGKAQRVCGKPACDKEQRRRNAAKYRKRKS